MTQAPTISDVAARAGVTKTAVSLALRQKSGVSEDTRARIMKIARELNYRPSPTRATRGRVHYGQVAFLAISEDEPLLDQEAGGSYLHSMLDGVREAAETAGTSVILAKMNWEQAHNSSWPAVLQRGHLDGVVVRGWMMPEVEGFFRSLGVPVVLADCDRRVEGVTQIQIDNIEGMDKLVDLLFARGARRFATITGDMEHANARERLAGLQMALTRRGADLPTEHIVFERGFNPVSGERGVRELVKRGVSCDAIVCHSDLIALGVSDYLSRESHPFSGRLQITGFDCMSFFRHMPLAVATIDPHPEKLGGLAFRALQGELAANSKEGVLIKVTPSIVTHSHAGAVPASSNASSS